MSGFEPTPADDGGAESEEGLMDVVADLPADPQPAEPVQQGDGLLDHPAIPSTAGAVAGAAAVMTGSIRRARTRARYLSWS